MPARRESGWRAMRSRPRAGASVQSREWRRPCACAISGRGEMKREEGKRCVGRYRGGCEHTDACLAANTTSTQEGTVPHRDKPA
eukprot:4208619-Prymnesium_polylepis.1